MRLTLKDGETLKLLDNVMSTSFDVIAEGMVLHRTHAGRDAAEILRLDLTSDSGSRAKPGQAAFRSHRVARRRSMLYSRVDSAVDDLMLVEIFR